MKGGGTKSVGKKWSVGEKKEGRKGKMEREEEGSRVTIICLEISTGSNKAVRTNMAAYPLDHSSV